MNKNVRSIKVSLSLAFRDLWHDKKITFCLIVSLASVVAPLLLLFGLKSGIIKTMEESFLKDPHKREIKIIGHYKLDPIWFDKLGEQADTGFLIPKIRLLNAQVDLLKDSRNFLKSVEVLPTKTTDPIISTHSQFPLANNEIIISHTVATKLGLNVGDPLTMVVSRKFQHKNQIGKIITRIIGVLPESAISKNAIFVDFALLLAVDDFKDQYIVKEFGIAEGNPRPTRNTYASARIYANSLAGVARLADNIRQGGVEVKTHAKDIETIQQTEQLLSFIVKIIAWVTIIGAAVSMTGFLIANVDRKRQHLAMLRLLGFTSFSIAMYPVIQSLAIATSGFLLAGGGYFLGAIEFDRVLGGYMHDQGYICQLSVKQIFVAYFLTVLVVLGAAIIGGFRAIQIEPAETFRQQ